MACAANPGSVTPSRGADLGGRLVFAGEVGPQTYPMVIAANVAGAATLVATADPVVQKQAVRDAVIDFVVNSLDEALRILKNEIRKRATVAVCVGIPCTQAEQEMIDRGVVPDVLVATSAELPSTAARLSPAAALVHPAALASDQALLSWTVAAAAPRWMPKLDAIAIECLQAEPDTQRWLHLAPRFAGRAAHSSRMIQCKGAAASQILDAFQQSVESGAIGADLSVNLHQYGETRSLRFSAVAT